MPADKLSNYSFATTKLEELKRQESELLLQYKEAYPLVQNVRERIQKLTRQKADLEQQYPALAHLLLSAAHGSTNTVGTDVLMARVAALGIILSNLQAQATQVMDLEPKIAELERLRAEHQKTYELVMARLEQQQRDESLVAGKVVNMSEVQSPTPPGLDNKKMKKLVGMVLAGCIGMGLGLAFLIDLFLDRSIKRVFGHRAAPPSAGVPEHSGHFLCRVAPPAALAGRLAAREKRRAKWGWRQRGRPGWNRSGAVGPGASTAELHGGAAGADHQLL